MRELVVSTFLTLDGIMQAPGTPEEDPTGGFTHGGWSVHYWDEEMYAAMAEVFSTPFDLLLGRKTYEIFAAHWPYVGDQERAARGGTASDVDSRTSSTGVVMATYRPAGAIDHGSFAFQNPTPEEAARRKRLAQEASE